tara:strand:+ start:7853 stop:8692 length:840 start_codon:yes stop_codon:yes gene_type:complete
MRLNYIIDDKTLDTVVDDTTKFFIGENVCLSQKFNDITQATDWYQKGYTILKSAAYFDVVKVKSELKSKIQSLLTKYNSNAISEKFRLEDYHNYVDEEIHNEIISQTRQINANDLNIDVSKFLKSISSLFSRELSWESGISYDPKIIARINMPSSKNFNPAHKDVYQVYDSTGQIPPMVNIWIPICGVSQKNNTGLPLVEGSHLLHESSIQRTKAGVNFNGQKYNVNCVKSWNGEVKLSTFSPKEDEFLIFSSFLIHGLAKNYNKNKTRISFEFRLFEK